MEENGSNSSETKFCKYCGAKNHKDAVICTSCGRQIEELKGSQVQPNVVVNNTNTNINRNVNGGYAGHAKNKWVALLLCIFLGYFGVHKFYEGNVGMGLLYLFTGGLCGIGVIIDFILLLFKPTTYYV